MQLAITRLCAKLIIKKSNHNKGLKSSVKWEFKDSTNAYLRLLKIYMDLVYQLNYLLSSQFLLLIVYLPELAKGVKQKKSPLLTTFFYE
jgi:hypothetical protein